MDLPVACGEILDGKYAVEAVIGEGGMGCVYAARHVHLDTPVAVKVLRPDASDDSRHRFLREARAASRIDNEHVARVFDVGELDDGTPYMVMELLEGRDLDELLYEEGPMPISTAVGYVLQACDALSAAHQRGVVHRDVKPANLFVARCDGEPPCIKLLDFGISKMAARTDDGCGTLTSTGSCLGSPLFMSPEQLLSCRSVDSRSDVWSLGVSLFELLTCQAVFPGKTVAELYTAILRDEPRRLCDIRPDAPAALEEVILRCLQKEADHRVQSAAELAALLQPFARLDETCGDAPASADPEIEWSVIPSRQAAWIATEIMDQPPALWLDDGDLEGPESPDSTSRTPASASCTDGARELPELDQTPGATVHPVAEPGSTPPVPSRWLGGRWHVAGALLAAGLLAGGLLGAAGSAALVAPTSPVPAIVPPAPPGPPSTERQVAAPAPAPVRAEPTPPSGDPSPLVYSTQLSDSQRERLLQEIEAAEHELAREDYEQVLARVAAVVRELGTLGVEPRQANSTIGAKAQLLVGRVEAAKARAILSEAPRSWSETRGWAKRLEVRVARARVAYDRVITWGVRSFYRCALVEMAALDGELAPAFLAAAPDDSGPQRDWCVAEARRSLKRARVGLRTALNVQSETMLCIDEAQRALAEVSRQLEALAE